MKHALKNWWNTASTTKQVAFSIAVAVTSPIWFPPVLLVYVVGLIWLLVGSVINDLSDDDQRKDE